MPHQILYFPLLCHYRIMCVISCPECPCPAILFPVLLLWRAYILLTETAEIVVPQSCIMFVHSMCQKSTPFPCHKVVVCLSIPSEAPPRFSEHTFFSGVGLLTP